MKVKDCNDCPFRVDTYDDWSIGYDTVSTCNLASFNGHYLHLLAYDRHDENVEPITTPKECPLKEGNIEIQLEEINM